MEDIADIPDLRAQSYGVIRLNRFPLGSGKHLVFELYIEFADEVFHADFSEVDILGTATSHDRDIHKAEHLQDHPEILRGDVAVPDR